MSKGLVHKLVGYDRQTERAVSRCDIPRKHLDYAKRTANVDRRDPDAIGAYPLSRMQARDIAGTIGCDFDPSLDYFLQSYSRKPDPKPAPKHSYA